MVGVEVVDLVEEEVVVGMGVAMVVCCVVRVEEAEAGGEASQGLSRSRSRRLLFDE